LTNDELQLLEFFYKKILLQPSPPSVYATYGKYKAECLKRGIPECSYKTFNERFKNFDPRYITLKQKGFRAAYARGPEPREVDIDWDLPYHGDFIFEIAHVD